MKKAMDLWISQHSVNFLELIDSKNGSSAHCYVVGIERTLGTVFTDGCSFLNAELKGRGEGCRQRKTATA